MKRFSRIILLVLTLALMLSTASVFAAAPTDQILNYEITVDPVTDATLNITYHIEWKVLESDGIGPLSWVNIGIPNSHVEYIEPLSENISYIGYESDGGSFLRVEFDDDYYEGEVVSFDFVINQDYMYNVDMFEQGKTVYQFTPGWFDEIAVDNITVRWSLEGIDSWNPSCKQDGGYLVWNDSLRAGEAMETVQVVYPNDVLGFDSSKYMAQGDDYNGGNYSGGDYYYSSGSVSAAPFVGIPVIIWIILIVSIIKRVKNKYSAGSGFTESTKKKVTRTKVVYYPSCQSCGAVRAEGETNCSYCGRSFIKSEEVLKEEEIPNEERNKYSEKGEYRYSGSPNTYVRVNVINVPVRVPISTPRGPRSGGGGCAHSSCACACVSCACACACAGGGRAGCSTKDFYNTGLKLKQLEFRKKHRKQSK